MPDILPPPPKLRVIQTPGPVARTALDKLDHLIVVTAAKPDPTIWKNLPDGRHLEMISRRADTGKPVRSRLRNAATTGITLGRLPKPSRKDDKTDAFKLLKFSGDLVADALTDNPKSLAIIITGLTDEHTESVAHALILAAGARAFRLPTYKSKPDKKSRLTSIRLLGCTTRLNLDRTLIENDACNLARWLTQLPPNKLDAGQYRELVATLAKENNWTMKFLGEAQLRRKNAGAFLAVAQGNATRDAGIIHLKYRPTKATRPILSLVGKGIVFDTGGTNLKPFKSMLDMHEDMAGSAVALATFLALTRLNFGYPVDCWLAITENRLSADAYKSRDVVTASNGMTIEVIHTDAEGRMVLADTLALAGAEKPGMIIDYATLTGSCVSALTERYSGVFTNTPALNTILIDAGRDSGERVWPFPMDDDFEEDLSSKVADILQCSPGGGGDHILAARFLQRFVPADSAWVHVDLSAAARKDGLAQIPPGPTGFGVRFTLNLINEQGEQLESLIGQLIDDGKHH